MKRTQDVYRSSFTLVELLVVLGIITILASVLFAVGQTAIRAALRAKAGNMANQIQLACMSYQNDYAVLPLPATNVSPFQPQYSDVNNWQNLIYCLSGNSIQTNGGTFTTSTATPSNTKSISYLQLSSSSVDTNGVPVNPISPTNGSYFNIAFDGAYTGVITNVPVFGTGTMTAASSSTQVSASVYVWANCNPSSTSTNPNWWVHAP